MEPTSLPQRGLFRALALASFALLMGCQYYVYDVHGCDDPPNPERPCTGEGCGGELDGGLDAGSRAEPPSGGPCRIDGDCRAGEACVEGSCTEAGTCALDEDCPEGSRCDFRGTCVAPIGCRSGADCGDGEVCVEGSCRSHDETCHFDHDCGPERGCVDNACRALCDSDAACESGERCEEGRCLPELGCTTSLDCDQGEHCAEGRCLAACDDAGAPGSPESCGPEELCGEDGLCRPDVAPRPFCVDDAGCAPGRICQDGVCRTPCPSGEDGECLLYDSQLIRCGESVSGLLLCFSRHETDPECRAPSDCAEGGRCIDAFCH